MYYHEDWLMRQIEMMISIVIRMITGKEQKISSQSSMLFSEVMDLFKQGQICEAENRLFFALEANEETTLETAIAFYSELNKLDDKELESKNFSRNEIMSGLQEACRLNGFAYDMFL